MALACACGQGQVVSSQGAETAQLGPSASPTEARPEPEPEPNVADAGRAREAVRGYGPGLDLSGFIDVSTAVVQDGEIEWLVMRGGDGGGEIRLTPVPKIEPADTDNVAAARCVEDAPYLGFDATPRVRLALRSGRVALEREGAKCWVEVPEEIRKLQDSKDLRVVGPASRPLTVSLDKLDRGLATLAIVVGEDEVSLSRAEETVLNEPLDAAAIVTDGAAGPTDRRELVVVARRERGRVVELVVTVSEALTGDPSPIGGSREYERRLRWVVALDGEAAHTRELVADMEAPFSGDGYSGAERGHVLNWRRDFAGGSVTGLWSGTSRGAGSLPLHELRWRIVANDDSEELELALPDFKRAMRDAKAAAPAASHRVVLGQGDAVDNVGLDLRTDALVVEVLGSRHAWPLLPAAGPNHRDDRATFVAACNTRACRIDAMATRPKVGGAETFDELGWPVEVEDSRQVSVLVSRRTGQAILRRN